SRLGRRETARGDAGYLPKDRPAGAKLRFGRNSLRRCPGEARFCLSDVSASCFANLEAISGGSQVPSDHLFVIDIEPNFRLVAPDVHVGCHRIEKYALLAVDQQGALRHHLVLGPRYPSLGAPAAIERLAHSQFYCGRAASLG